MSKKLLYLDESGNHEIQKIDPDYPVFVLGGVIVDASYAKTVLEADVCRFKYRWFSDSNVVLHTADMVRNRFEFVMLKDSAVRERFYRDLNAMMRRLDYSVVAVGVRKYEFRDHGRLRYRRLDLYSLGFELLLELFYDEVVKARAIGEVVAEQRLPELDRRLIRSWERHLRTGASNVASSEFGRRIGRLDLKPKSENIARLQLADLVVSPIGRHVIGKHDKEDWRIIRGKVLNGSDASGEGYGLITLP